MYRHYLEHPHTKTHFIGPKEVELFLEAELKALAEIDKRKIGLAGKIGSVTEGKIISYDIDHLMVPAEGVGLGDFLLEVGRFYKIVDTLVSEKGYFLALSPRFVYQEHMYYLCAQEKGGYENMIPIHNLVFFDMENVVGVVGEKFAQRVMKKIVPVHGSIDVLVNRKIIDPDILENHFYVAEGLMYADTNLPEELAFDYAMKKLLYMNHWRDIGITAEQIREARNTKEARLLTAEALKYLDAQLRNVA